MAAVALTPILRGLGLTGSRVSLWPAFRRPRFPLWLALAWRCADHAAREGAGGRCAPSRGRGRCAGNDCLRRRAVFAPASRAARRRGRRAAAHGRDRPAAPAPLRGRHLGRHPDRRAARGRAGAGENPGAGDRHRQLRARADALGRRERRARHGEDAAGWRRRSGAAARCRCEPRAHHARMGGDRAFRRVRRQRRPDLCRARRADARGAARRRGRRHGRGLHPAGLRDGGSGLGRAHPRQRRRRDAGPDPARSAGAAGRRTRATAGR